MYAIECCGNDLQWHGQSSGGYVVRTLMLDFNVSAPNMYRSLRSTGGNGR